MSSKNYTFKADISKLMNLIINSMYSNKDIFLRELISNASDAIDKARYNHLTNNVNNVEYNIKVKSLKDEKILIIEDNGIGMNEEDLIENLSTIAHSGTKDFLEKNKLDNDMIGQFGVGFYSAYLVAEKVDVISKKEGEKAYKWSSDAASEFTIEETEFDGLSGTQIILHMKEDSMEYLEDKQIKDIIKQHSQFITYPILLYETKLVEKKVEEDEKVAEDEEVVEEEEDNESEVPKVEEVEEDNDEVKPTEPPKEIEKEWVSEWNKVNGSKPLWYEKPNEPTEDEYTSFYKTISNDWDGPLHYKHFIAEGQLEFRGIFFIPKRPPFDMFSGGMNKEKKNIKLYVKKVLIMDDCKELVPDWLNFVTGVIDSSDLPLNVSREMLQQNHTVRMIKKHLVKQVIEMLTEISSDEEKYKTFYENFSKNIKLGVYEDDKNNEKLAKFLRFKNNVSDKLMSLDEYIERKDDESSDETQEKKVDKVIHYLAGENLEAVKSSIFLEKFDKLRLPVLFCTDAIDEFMITKLRTYGGYNFVNIAHDSVKLNEEESKSDEERLESLLKFMSEHLKEKVEKVKVSTRLDKYPSCIVTDQNAWSSNMERIMKAQTLGDERA